MSETIVSLSDPRADLTSANTKLAVTPPPDPSTPRTEPVQGYWPHSHREK